MTIVLCRHGSTDANAGGRFLSRTDLPLNTAGRKQCAALREALARFEIARCFVSPMRRCIETVAIAAPALPYTPCDELREIDFGAWELATAEDVRHDYPEEFERRRLDPVHFRPPNGESFNDVADRLAPFMGRIPAPGGNVLIVAHRGTLSVLERLLRGIALDDRSVAAIEPGSFRRIQPAAGVLPAAFPSA